MTTGGGGLRVHGWREGGGRWGSGERRGEEGREWREREGGREGERDDEEGRKEKERDRDTQKVRERERQRLPTLPSCLLSC